MAKAALGDAITYADDRWHDGSPPLISPMQHGMWLASTVFDGARSLGGAMPDLDLHCARAVRSAKLIGLAPKISGPEIESLAREGVARFPADAELYICPVFYAESGFIVPDPESTRFVLTISDSPLPPPDGFSACLSSFRRPARDMAPTEAKASCLYPNVARCAAEANSKGFDTAVVLDPAGNVAEFDHTNLFLGKDGALHTPAPNGTFLNGITRQRVIKLMKADGVEVNERAIDFGDVLNADELFETGNYVKLRPCTRIEDRALQPGPLFMKARELYFKFARREI